MNSAIDSPAGHDTVVLLDGSHLHECWFGQIVVERILESALPVGVPLVACSISPLLRLPWRKVLLKLEANASDVAAEEPHYDRPRYARLAGEDVGDLEDLVGGGYLVQPARSDRPF